MQHQPVRHTERCLLPDPVAYAQILQQAIEEAHAVRDQLELELGGTNQNVKDFGHDINNAVGALLSAVTLASKEGPPLLVVNTLLDDYVARVDQAFQKIRPQVNDAALLQKIDALQERTDGIFGHLQLAKEKHHYPQADELRQVKILGMVGPQGQKGIWV